MNESLRAELVTMAEADQVVRQGLGPEAFQDTAFMERLLRTDAANRERLTEIIEQHGWPTAELVGRAGAEAAFLLLQHGPVELQERMLPEIEREVRARQLDPQDYALLVDRVRAKRGQPQLYGTQYELKEGDLVQTPVEEPEQLHRRRSELGLPPIADYERALREQYGLETAQTVGPSNSLKER